MVTVGIHQPNFLPYFGYFEKIRKSDIFILADDDQFTQKDYINRNRIKAGWNIQWITIPFKHPHSFVPINAIELADYKINASKILRTLEYTYGKAKNYATVYSGLQDVMSQNYTHIVELNVNLIRWAMELLKIETPLVLASSLPHTGSKTEEIISLVKLVGGTHYLAGGNSANYHDEELFKKEGIGLLENNFIHPIYQQKKGEFIQNLSIIDYLFNV